jgi:hypothetical protein
MSIPHHAAAQHAVQGPDQLITPEHGIRDDHPQPGLGRRPEPLLPGVLARLESSPHGRQPGHRDQEARRVETESLAGADQHGQQAGGWRADDPGQRLSALGQRIGPPRLDPQADVGRDLQRRHRADLQRIVSQLQDEQGYQQVAGGIADVRDPLGAEKIAKSRFPRSGDLTSAPSLATSSGTAGAAQAAGLSRPVSSARRLAACRGRFVTRTSISPSARQRSISSSLSTVHSMTPWP